MVYHSVITTVIDLIENSVGKYFRYLFQVLGPSKRSPTLTCFFITHYSTAQFLAPRGREELRLPLSLLLLLVRLRLDLPLLLLPSWSWLFSLLLSLLLSSSSLSLPPLLICTWKSITIHHATDLYTTRTLILVPTILAPSSILTWKTFQQHLENNFLK